MSGRPDTEVFVITLRAEMHDVPAIIRLRAALKRLLRDYGLKCVSLTETPARAVDARAGLTLSAERRLTKGTGP